MATTSTVTGLGRDFELSNSEYLSLANANVGTLRPGDTDFSGEIWFKMESKTGSGGFNTLASLYNSTGNQRCWLLTYQVSLDSLILYISSNGSTVSSVTASTFGSPSLDTWYRACYRHNATANTIEIKIDTTSAEGTWDSASHSGGAYGSSTANFVVGAFGSGTGHFDGVLDGYRHWTEAAADSKFTSTYNSGAGKNHQDLTATELTNLYVSYDLQETSGIAYNATATATKDLSDVNTVLSAAGNSSYTANKAAQFVNANSEYLNVPDASLDGLDFSGNVDFAISAWVYLDNQSTVQDLFGRQSNTVGSYGYWCYYHTTGTAFNFAVSGNGTAFTIVTASTFGTPVNANWYFIRVKHDATADKIYISINMGAWNEAAHSTGVNDNSKDFVIGGRDGGGSFNLDGRVANVIVTSGIPTEGEWGEIYERGYGADAEGVPSLSTATYVAHMVLNEASGTRLDSVGSNDLTDNNTVTQADGIVEDTEAAAAAGGNVLMPMMGVG